MMKKVLAGLGLAGLLAIPAGAAWTAPESDEPPATQSAMVAAGDTVQTQLQAQSRERIHDPSECDGDAQHLREQVRTRTHTTHRVDERPTGSGFGAGPQDGSGPLHEGPGDGSGNQYGRGRT